MSWTILDVAIGQGSGGGGGISNPGVGTLADDEMIKASAGGTSMVGTGDKNTDVEVNFGSKDVRCKTVITESGSVDVGPNLTLSERGGYLQTHTNTTGRDFISVDYLVNDSGTERPSYDERSPLIVRDVTQPDDSQVMLNVTTYSFTPPVDNDLVALYAKFVNPVTNFRFKVVSDVTGEPIKFYPSRNDWDNGTGVSFQVGEQRAELDTPLAELTTVPITVFAMADQSIDVLGDGSLPWRAADIQTITRHDIALSDDVKDRFWSLSRSTQSFTSTEQVVETEITKDSVGISMLNNSEIVFNKAGLYSIFADFNLSVASGFANFIEIWAESYTPSAPTWTPAPDSGLMVDYSVFAQGVSLQKVNALVGAGTKLRVKIRTTGGTSELLSTSLANGVVVPSVSYSIKEG